MTADGGTITGTDTFTRTTAPNKPYWNMKYPELLSGQRFVFLSLKSPVPRGAAVITGKLRAKVRGSAWAASRQLIAKPLAAQFTSKTTDNNKPGVLGSNHATITVSGLADGDYIEFDVTNALQAISNGTAAHGWRIESNNGSLHTFYGFDSGAAWELEAEWSDAPDQPTNLVPGNGVISVAKPVVGYDYGDINGVEDLAKQQVQMNPTNSFTSPAFDSGWLATTVPQLDLNTTAYAGLSAGSSAWWRVRVEDESGQQSVWSDPVQITRTAKLTPSWVNPSGGVVFSPTPDVSASVTGGTLSAYRLIVAQGNDKSAELYNSGKVPASGTTINLTLPLKDDNGRKILTGAGPYWFGLQVYDTVANRKASPGDPTYAEAWVQVTVNKDGAVPGVTGLTVTQVGSTPVLQISFVRSTPPDEFVLVVDGVEEIVWELADLAVAGTTYTATWYGTNAYDTHAYIVRAIDDGHQSNNSSTFNFAHKLGGVWLIRDTGEMVKLKGIGGVDEWTQNDRRGIYQAVNSAYQIEVIDAIEGIRGSYKGSLSLDATQDRTTARSILRKIKSNPTEVVTLAAAELAIPIRPRNLVVDLPSSEYVAVNKRNRIEFEFSQTADVPYGAG